MKKVLYRPPTTDGKAVPAFVVWQIDGVYLLSVPTMERNSFTYHNLLVIAHDEDLDGTLEDFPEAESINQERRNVQEVEALLEELGESDFEQ